MSVLARLSVSVRANQFYLEFVRKSFILVFLMVLVVLFGLNLFVALLNRVL
jgi:hypothetical protein